MKGKNERKKKAARLRCVPGCVLILLSLAVCLLPAFLAGTSGIPSKFQASGREAVLQPPAFPNGTIDINDAEAEELLELPGVGETLAALIIEERQKNGPFHYPEDLTVVKGIGKQKLRQMLSWLRFD